MTDPTELIARLENGFLYTQSGEASDVPDQAAAIYDDNYDEGLVE